MSNFKKLPINLKPREKLKFHGTSRLTDQELLAIILQSGSSQFSVMQISQMLFEKYQTFENILSQSLQELMTNPGIGEVKAINLKAIHEIIKKTQAKPISNMTIKHPKDIVASVEYLKNKEQEHLVVIAVDSRFNIINQEEIFIGTINEIIIHPREIFVNAIKSMAYGIILVHNHPSGNSNPSENDIISTNKLVEIGKFLNIKVLDHLIISKNDYYSLRENNDIIN